jgi:propionyl-CoA synthetase
MLQLRRLTPRFKKHPLTILRTSTTIMPPHPQDEIQSHSLRDPEAFWSHQASQLHWHTPPSRALHTTTKTLPNGVSHPSTTWFPDGEISTSYNCIDRHVINGNGDATAIIWDSPVTGSKETYTYAQLLEEVEVLAGVLREEGVRKGDVVLVYSAPPLSLWRY